MLKRYLKQPILDRLKKEKKKNKIILLYGVRQTGKTTLAREILDELGLKNLMVNADQIP